MDCTHKTGKITAYSRTLLKSKKGQNQNRTYLKNNYPSISLRELFIPIKRNEKKGNRNKRKLSGPAVEEINNERVREKSQTQAGLML